MKLLLAQFQVQLVHVCGQTRMHFISEQPAWRSVRPTMQPCLLILVAVAATLQ